MLAVVVGVGRNKIDKVIAELVKRYLRLARLLGIQNQNLWHFDDGRHEITEMAKIAVMGLRATSTIDDESWLGNTSFGT